VLAAGERFRLLLRPKPGPLIQPITSRRDSREVERLQHANLALSRKNQPSAPSLSYRGGGGKSQDATIAAETIAATL
jgi:hypothetical protein